jgi:hypothetical protein
MWPRSALPPPLLLPLRAARTQHKHRQQKHRRLQSACTAHEVPRGHMKTQGAHDEIRPFLVSSFLIFAELARSLQPLR